MTSKDANGKRGFSSERGAALITVLMISVPLLMAGGALIMITSMSAATTADSAAETKAFYAAEAGAQQVLGVLRGNTAPNPLFVANPLGGIAPENQISFRRAVDPTTSNLASDPSDARLSRWLNYDPTYTDRVPLTGGYSPITGLAFSTVLTDPDNSRVLTFSTSGVFTNYGSDTHRFTGVGSQATLKYRPQAATTITSSGNSTFGNFLISDVEGTVTLSNEPFLLTVTQTAPWPVTVAINCTLSGSISSSSSLLSITFPTQTNNIGGTVFARSANPVNTNGTNPIAVSVTAPQPNRLTVGITGYGPRSSQKQLQMLLNRFAFDFSAVSTITLRSADDNSLSNFGAGSSAVYFYSGFDNAGGQNLPALGVTSQADYDYITGAGLSSTQVVGSPANIQKVPVANLPLWLQNADLARSLVIQLRIVAQNNNRYFTPLSPPLSYGTPTNPLFTFVDGDCALPPAGGAGLLITTGSLVPDGSASFDGLILVLGGGQLIRSGGGNGNTLGSMVIARFGTSGNFLAPTFQSNGSGNSSVQYDSAWVRRALASPGPTVMAVGEF